MGYVTIDNNDNKPNAKYYIRQRIDREYVFKFGIRKNEFVDAEYTHTEKFIANNPVAACTMADTYGEQHGFNVNKMEEIIDIPNAKDWSKAGIQKYLEDKKLGIMRELNIVDDKEAENLDDRAYNALCNNKITPQEYDEIMDAASIMFNQRKSVTTISKKVMEFLHYHGVHVEENEIGWELSWL